MRNRQQFLGLLAGALCALPAGALAKGARSGDYCLEQNPQQRRNMRDFTLPVLDGDGKTLRFSEIAGKAVWLNFYATWCPPCNKEMPNIVAMEAKYRDAGLAVVGIDVGESAEKARAFQAKYKIPFPILLDSDFAVYKSIFKNVGFPSSMFFAGGGLISCIVMDDLTWKQMDNEIAVALGA